MALSLGGQRRRRALDGLCRPERLPGPGRHGGPRRLERQVGEDVRPDARLPGLRLQHLALQGLRVPPREQCIGQSGALHASVGLAADTRASDPAASTDGASAAAASSPPSAVGVLQAAVAEGTELSLASAATRPNRRAARCSHVAGQPREAGELERRAKDLSRPGDRAGLCLHVAAIPCRLGRRVHSRREPGVLGDEYGPRAEPRRKRPFPYVSVCWFGGDLHVCGQHEGVFRALLLSAVLPAWLGSRPPLRTSPSSGQRADGRPGVRTHP
mmetsp:Transcript_37330/g.101022  ORF Transcript_37330/g.101022 Transcript_37330/m.101022 type:complete len:271 (+) Transcript_37330:510-1322(+)